MKKPSHKEMILHHCHQCLGYYADGKQDCENTRCPLYSAMPYRKMEPDLWLFEYSPKKVGLKKKTEPTEEQVERGKKLAAMMRDKN